eukprot:scaffold254708_cov17-Prasinocladus_malaysianus.AAC.1
MALLSRSSQRNSTKRIIAWDEPIGTSSSAGGAMKVGRPTELRTAWSILHHPVVVTSSSSSLSALRRMIRHGL